MKTDLISRRSFLSVVGAVGAAAALTACGGSASSTASSAAASEAAGESVELIVFAAASLTETLKAQDILFCMGNSDVPVGQYTQKILAYYDLDEAALAAAGVITYGSNVKEVTTQVSEASVDAGVVYCTDAYSAGLTPVDEATKEMCGQVIYPAAVMKNALHAEAAREFLAYLRTDKAATVFESVGFTAL